MSRRSRLKDYSTCLAWRTIAAVLCSALGAVTIWSALSPQPDWYDAPIHVLPPRFVFSLGSLGSDTFWHAFVLALLPPGLVLLFGLPRTWRTASWMVGGILSGSVLIELVQGLLPYRNFELMDVLANLAGSSVALGALALLRRRNTKPCRAPRNP